MRIPKNERNEEKERKRKRKNQSHISKKNS
jgi:hypothetical protein